MLSQIVEYKPSASGYTRVRIHTVSRWLALLVTVLPWHSLAMVRHYGLELYIGIDVMLFAVRALLEITCPQ